MLVSWEILSSRVSILKHGLSCQEIFDNLAILIGPPVGTVSLYGMPTVDFSRHTPPAGVRG